MKQLTLSTSELLHSVEGDCFWCSDAPAITIVYDEPTCVDCAASREQRVTAYLQRLKEIANR